METEGPRNRTDLLYLILQFLKEQNLNEIAEELKREMRTFFDYDLFEMMVDHSLWNKAEAYLSSFGKSRKNKSDLQYIFYELQKLKYFQALMEPNEEKARNILNNEMRDLSFNKFDVADDIKQINDVARASHDSGDNSIEFARTAFKGNLKEIIEDTPCFKDDYLFRHLKDSSLWELNDLRFNLAQLAISSQSVCRRRPRSFISGCLSPLNPGKFAERTKSEDKNPRLTGASSSRPLLSKIDDSADRLQSLRLPADTFMDKARVLRLTYSNSGTSILALLSNGRNVVWKWPQIDLNPTGKPTTRLPAELVEPSPLKHMINNLSDASLDEDISCFSLSKDDSLLYSASGAEISIYCPTTFEKQQTDVKFLPPSPAATCLALHPQDNNIIAVGKDDGIIEIYDLGLSNVVITRLKGHTERITGLAFSEHLCSLVSSGADAQIVIWSMNNWEKKASTYLQIPPDLPVSARSKTEVQFHNDGTRLLVVNETLLAIYDASTLECKDKKWILDKFSAPIHHATFSCDGELIYSSFHDGTLCIFSSTGEPLKVKCLIKASAYIRRSERSEQYRYPIVVAAHPSSPDQIAVGLTDGQVYVLDHLASAAQ